MKLGDMARLTGRHGQWCRQQGLTGLIVDKTREGLDLLYVNATGVSMVQHFRSVDWPGTSDFTVIKGSNPGPEMDAGSKI